jgi:hypothetical protein
VKKSRPVLVWSTIKSTPQPNRAMICGRSVTV